jgi:hypothetical protein
MTDKKIRNEDEDSDVITVDDGRSLIKRYM